MLVDKAWQKEQLHLQHWEAIRVTVIDICSQIIAFSLLFLSRQTFLSSATRVSPLPLASSLVASNWHSANSLQYLY